MNRTFFQPAIVATLVLMLSLGCGALTGTPQAQTMGTIKIVNAHVRGSDPFPGGKNLPDAREYGICILAYPLPNPAGLTKPAFDMILAKDGEQTTYGLPAGTYTVQEWQFDSEINQDPLYSPAVKNYVRPPEMVVLKANETVVFGSGRTGAVPGDFFEGQLLSPNCLGGLQQPGRLPTPTSTPTATRTTTPTATPTAPPAATPAATPVLTPKAATGAWALKLIQPDVGKSEAQFSYPGLACSGGTKVTASETSASTTTAGTCQVKGALVANEKTQHSWSRPPDQLTPGQELSGSMNVSQSGLCSWTVATTEAGCRTQATTSHIVWQGDGWPGGPVEFPYRNLIYGNDSNVRALASTRPTGSFKWKVPSGASGGKTLVLQFVSASSGGKVYTNFWYEWQAP
ncbi:MAG: hypothetical protein HZB53_08540 [Chloroflexi bacterium]|nr:hypothetical protein [Chloroflexota bacterium]